ncbi:MAG TPA: glycosyltransferase [Thermoanaerobaculia bacterium]|nr:glycosyltransferase [Thermoanaerobaculia bacterium]HXK67645.1 glycosyltransferase [Thermoanaerobaculia bacterium]
MTAIKVLHAVGNLNAGGVEKGIAALLPVARQYGVDSEVLCLMGTAGTLLPRFREEGIPVHVVPRSRVPKGGMRILRFGNYLTDFLKDKGFSAVHVHVFYLSGVCLKAAHKSGISYRIAHIHAPVEEYRSTGRGQLALRVNRILLRQHATRILGVAPHVLEGYFPESRQGGDRFDLVPAVFHPEEWAHPSGVEDGCGDVLRITQVGRLHRAKNHLFSLKIASRLAEKKIPFTLQFVGDGPLKEEIEREIQTRNLQSFVTLAGEVDSVKDILQRETDLFIFPSRYEGIPLAVLEAQAAGIPCVISDAVPKDAIVVPEIVTRLPLDRMDLWIETIQFLAVHRPAVPGNIMNRFQSSLFNPQRNMERILPLYGIIR